MRRAARGGEKDGAGTGETGRDRDGNGCVETDLRERRNAVHLVEKRREDSQLHALPSATPTPAAAPTADGDGGTGADDGLDLVNKEDGGGARAAEGKEFAHGALRLAHVRRVERRAR